MFRTLIILTTLLVSSCASTIWIEGEWEGEGNTSDGQPWKLHLYAENGVYLVDYPDLDCGGEWAMIEMKSSTYTFQECITVGGSGCSTDAVAVVTKYGDEICVDYYDLGWDPDFPWAFATLTRSK